MREAIRFVMLKQAKRFPNLIHAGNINIPCERKTFAGDLNALIRAIDPFTNVLAREVFAGADSVSSNFTLRGTGALIWACNRPVARRV